MCIRDRYTSPPLLLIRTWMRRLTRSASILSLIHICKVPILTKENTDLKAKVKTYEDKAEAEDLAARKQLLDAAEQDGRIAVSYTHLAVRRWPCLFRPPAGRG